MSVTTLPMAHEFAAPAEGRRCADCARRRSNGVHRFTPTTRTAMHARSTGRYRTSGTPYLARPGVWTAMAR